MSEEKLRKLERVKPEILQTFLLDELCGRLADLQDVMIDVRETLRQTIPKGVAESLTLTVSDKVQQVKPTTPWVSFSIYNRSSSANTVYVMVNKRGADRHPIEPDDSYDVDMKVPIIKAIYLVCDSGGSATVDLSAVR